MKRYLIERRFPHGLPIASNAEGRRACASVVAVNTQQRVTWLHSYVGIDGTTVFCLYEAPCADAVRAASERNGLALDRIAEVSVLDPYFYVAP